MTVTLGANPRFFSYEGWRNHEQVRILLSVPAKENRKGNR
jgi:hypothetical protein